MNAEEILQTLLFNPSLSTVSCRVWAFVLLNPGKAVSICSKVTGIPARAIRKAAKQLEKDGLIYAMYLKPRQCSLHAQTLSPKMLKVSAAGMASDAGIAQPNLDSLPGSNLII